MSYCSILLWPFLAFYLSRMLLHSCSFLLSHYSSLNISSLGKLPDLAKQDWLCPPRHPQSTARKIMTASLLITDYCLSYQPAANFVTAELNCATWLIWEPPGGWWSTLLNTFGRANAWLWVLCQVPYSFPLEVVLFLCPLAAIDEQLFSVKASAMPFLPWSQMIIDWAYQNVMSK